MTQTEKYKLNLPDGGDRISPKPLNENMETLEKALIGQEEAAGKAMLAAVGVGGYTARIAFGSYVGGGGFGPSHRKTIEVDFKPMLVQVMPGAGPSTAEGISVPSAFVRESATALGNTGDSLSVSSLMLEWGDRTVSWFSNRNASNQLNQQGRTYHWTAIGYDAVNCGGADNGEA